MASWNRLGTVLVASSLAVGCSDGPREDAGHGAVEALPSAVSQTAAPATATLQLSLKNAEYCGGESEKHWQLTVWELENQSSQPVDEAVVIVSLFDNDGIFIGHHSVTFGHLMPGESETQKRLLLLKSDNVGQWKSRFESIHSRAQGDVTHECTLSNAPDQQAW